MPAPSPFDTVKRRAAAHVAQARAGLCAAAIGLAALGAAGLAAPAIAQGMFAPAVIINDRAITNWEVTQRATFLQLFNTPGDLVEEAIERLIEEKLQLMAAQRFGVTVSDEDVLAGMEEFASRVELDVDEFLQIIGANGIEPETYEAFIRAGVTWRRVLGTRFAPRVNISDAEVDRAMALYSQRGAVRVLLSEILLPLTGTEALVARDRARELANLRGFDAFARAAREFSTAESAASGGQIDWIPLANLPPELAGLILSLSPGQVTPAVPVPGGLIIYQLRQIQELETIPPAAISVRYAQLRLPGRTSGAAARDLERITARIDRCDDLYALTRTTPDRLVIEERKLSEVPADIAVQLATLDENEGNTALSQGDTLVYTMLCERILASDGRLDREAISERLFNERIGALSAAFLAEMRADATIIRR